MKTCPQCSELFMPSRKHPEQKHCSKECGYRARTTRVVEICATCGKATKRKKSRSERLNLAFCSKGCNQEYRKANPVSGPKHHQYIERTKYTCDYCGKSVFRLPSRVRKYVFCDVACRLEWQRESGYMQGEKSPTWLGGHEDSRGPGWRRQRRAARKRDKFTCQRCGITTKEAGKALDVHHIRPYREFGGDWKSANHLDNLVSLCNSCHQIVEWESGARIASPTSD